MGKEGDESSLIKSLIERLEEDEEKKNKKPPHIVAPYVINGIAIVVTLVWAGSFIADVTMVTYNPPPQIHMVMLGIVGSLFGFQVVHRTKNGSSS